ncbi:MAG TPA: SET domain-containing methyltransferase [Blastocatellia bacterium]|nr:SET domain-containing methyltransferase [Blastocatellia bacterium]
MICKVEMRIDASLHSAPRLCDGGIGLFSSMSMAKGQVLVNFNPVERITQPTRYSIQIDETEHLALCADIDSYINHSCDANTYVAFPSLYLHALRDIRSGEELTINYCSTEEDLLESFECLCEAKDCYGRVRGFKYLDNEQRKKLIVNLAPYLKRKYHVD